MHEEFLDDVFDFTNRMGREEWIKAVCDKAKWILTAQGVRKKVKANLAKEGYVVKDVDPTPSKEDAAPTPSATTKEIVEPEVMPFEIADNTSLT